MANVWENIGKNLSFLLPKVTTASQAVKESQKFKKQLQNAPIGQVYKGATGKKLYGGYSSSGGGTSSFGGGATSGGGFRGGTAQTTENNTSAQDALNAYLSSGGSGGGGGSAAIMPQMVDLTDILASYEQGAAAQRQAITDSRESQRQSLLTSLKRFQDETAEARAQQRRSYNASRADLEGQAFMANRQAAQSAAARGLGGSGLQQLAQLQNLISQEQAADKLAQSNTDVLKQLATAAQSKEEDTNTALQNLDTETANKLAQIDANNAQARANLQYQEAVRYEEARQAAQSLAAQLAASNSSAAESYRLQALENAAKEEASRSGAESDLAAILKTGTNKIKSARNSSATKGKDKSQAIQNAYDEAYNALYNTLAGYKLPISMADTYAQQLEQAFNTNYDKKHKYK